ncbi:MAG: AMP-binding protein [bacterium]|nr:AMP-binding protein [bacterium]
MTKWLKPENIVSLPEALSRRIRAHPERNALDYYGRKISYGELGSWVIKFSSVISMFAGGENEPDRIGIFMPNIPQFVFGLYGTRLARQIAVPVNFSSIATPLREGIPAQEITITPEIIANITDSKPKVILAADFFWPILKQIESELRDTALVFTSPGDFLPFHLRPFYPLEAKRTGKFVEIPKRDNIFFLKNLLREAESAEPIPEYPDADSVCQLQYTSGTSGEPKGAMLTHKNIISNVLQCRDHIGDLLPEGAIFLGALPFFHVYGLTMVLDGTLIGFGGEIVLLPQFNARKALDLVRENKIDVFLGVNRMFQRIGDLPDTLSVRIRRKLRSIIGLPCVPRYNRPSLKLCVSSAGGLDLEVKKKFEAATGARLGEGYGLSETSPCVSFALPHHDRPGSVGQPIAKVKILDLDADAELSVGKDGEIVVSGPQVMIGYYRKPQETSEVLKDGWFHTGDIGHVDEDGDLYFTGRKKEMSKILGENVPWPSVEKYVLKNPAVKKCAVIGVADRKTTEMLVVFGVMEKGFSKENLAAHISAVPNKIWLIREVIEIDEKIFAKWEDALGKIKKREVVRYYELISKTA